MTAELITTIFSFIVLFISIALHEISHGAVAYYLGDPTAKNEGRLTINPLAHIDIFGSIILPFSLSFIGLPVFGWAKPVPINPYNFKDQKWGEMKVAIAGPLSNFLVGVIFSLIIKFVALSASLFSFFTIIAIYNFALALFNLIPIPPLDGYRVLFAFLPNKFFKLELILRRYGLYILILILMFSSFGFIFRWSEFLFVSIAGF